MKRNTIALRISMLVAIMLGLYVSAFAQRPTENPPKPPVKEAPSGSSTQTQEQSKEGWSYNPDAGFVYQSGDFKWTIWGFGERLFNPKGKDTWRRVRQGMEFDLPRFTKKYRTAIVYEVDFTDNNFFRDRPKWKIFENLFFAIQDADDAGKFRALIGENTHILSREDNLSSGNLPVINRSLILEEHGSVNSFGTQFGIQVQKALSPRYTLALSAQDNRGSLNQDRPRYVIGNSLAAKLTGLALNDEKRGRKLTYGFGIDHTRNIHNRSFTLASAIAAEPLGGTEATGNKLSFEGDITYTGRIRNRPYTLEAEGLYSNFSRSKTNVGGGYVQGQVSLFDDEDTGDLDPFVRYDVVRLSREAIDGRALQQATRVGFNYNLPYTQKLANFRLEFADNRVQGAAAIVPVTRVYDEFRFELRLNVTRYIRH